MELSVNEWLQGAARPGRRPAAYFSLETSRQERINLDVQGGGPASTSSIPANLRSQTATQPTNLAFLRDVRVFRQSPRCCS